MKKTAIFILAAALAAAFPLQAQVTLLHEFTAGAGDGGRPFGSLVLSGSFLYGMAQDGGSHGLGTVFKVRTDGGGFVLLHEFSGGASDGSTPLGSLAVSGSTLYGMTQNGGAYGYGTIFKIQADGTGFALLHSFAAGTADGAEPCASLLLSGSTLYGMTPYYGAGTQGVVFKVQTDGNGFALLHSFQGGAGDGAFPFGSLVAAGALLYGMTSGGGDDNKGTVFRMQTDGNGFTLLHEFAGGGGDGADPRGSLLLAGSALYGMTPKGGGSDLGTVFKVGTDGSGFSLLHQFAGSAADGGIPHGSLVLSGSALFGMTAYGGSSDCGSLFRLAADGSGFALVHSFAGGAADGAEPYGDLFLAGSVLFGMTMLGGSSGEGTVFSHPLPYGSFFVFAGHDFDGNGGSEAGVFRPANNFFYIRGVGSYQWGTAGDKPASGDYDLDGSTDVAVFRPSQGKWLVRRSSTATALVLVWGADGDVPVPGDYDGDGQTDAAVWRPAAARWEIKGSAGTNLKLPWGSAGDQLVPCDYDGDGKVDPAVWRPLTGMWYVRGSAGANSAFSWGLSGDAVAAADYDGDGKADAAVFRASSGKWFIKNSGGGSVTVLWGQEGDLAAPGDYDHDGKADVAVFRPAAGKWFVRGSGGAHSTYSWGAVGDVPLVK